MVRHVTDGAVIRTDAPAVQTISLAPRPKPPVSVFAPAPEQTATWRKLAADAVWGDRYDRPAAWDAFGQGTDGAA